MENKPDQDYMQHALQARQQTSGVHQLRKNARVLAKTAFACIGGFLYGYNQGVFSGVLTMPAFAARMGPSFDSPTVKGWLTSILELGAWFGALYSRFIAEQFPRKYTIIFNCFIFIVGVVVQTCSIKVGAPAMLGGRFVTGTAIGSLSMVVPMYVAECAPPESRGLLIGLQQLAIELGVMISFWIDYGTNFIGGTGAGQSDAAWLLPFTLQLFPALTLLIGMLFMPFTPRWLIHHDREDQGRQVLAMLRSTSADSDAVELEFLEIKSQTLFEKRSMAEKFPELATPCWQNTAKLQFKVIGSLFTKAHMFKRVVVATVVMFFSQWTGINAILYYAPVMLGALGMSSNTTSLLATGVIGVVMLLATIPTLIWIDKIGRKSTMTIGALGMAFCHLAITIIFAKNRDKWASQQPAAWACVVLIWIYTAFFGWSWGPCEWIVAAEIWPLSVRSYGVSLATSANWMNNFIVGQVTPSMISNLGYGAFLVFGILIALGAGFVWFFSPETSGVSLEEMDVLFGGENVSASDAQLMITIQREIGLDRVANASVENHAADAAKPEAEGIELVESA